MDYAFRLFPQLVPALLLAIFGGVSVQAGDVFTVESTSHVVRPIEESSLWRVSLGVVWQSTGDISFRGSGFSRLGVLPRLADPGARNGAAGAAGPLTGVASRLYDDGFVGLSLGTGDPKAIDPQATSLWGYKNSTQVQGDSLNFHRTATVAASSEESRSSRNRWSDDDDSFGPHLQIDYLVPLRAGLRIGPQFAFQFGSVNVSHEGSTFEAQRLQSTTREDLTDSYDLQGIIPPAAPYRGTFNGPGPLIDNIPSRRTTTRTPLAGFGSQNSVYQNQIRESFESDFYNFSLGVGIEIDLTTRISIFVASGLSIRVADYESSYYESLSVKESGKNSRAFRKWERNSSAVEALYGGYLQTGAGFQVTKRCSINAFFRYDWLESLSGAVGRSSFRWSGSGATLGLAVGYTF